MGAEKQGVVEAPKSARDLLYERHERDQAERENRAAEGETILREAGFLTEAEPAPEGKAEDEESEAKEETHATDDRNISSEGVEEPEAEEATEPEEEKPETPDEKVSRLERELTESRDKSEKAIRAMQERIDKLTAAKKDAQDKEPDAEPADPYQKASDRTLHETRILASQLHYNRQKLGIAENAKLEDLTPAERAALVRENAEIVERVDAELLARRDTKREKEKESTRTLAESWDKSLKEAYSKYGDVVFERGEDGKFKRDDEGHYVVKAGDQIVKQIQEVFNDLRTKAGWKDNPDLPLVAFERVILRSQRGQLNKAKIAKTKAEREAERLRASTRTEAGIQKSSLVTVKPQDAPQDPKDYIRERRRAQMETQGGKR